MKFLKLPILWACWAAVCLSGCTLWQQGGHSDRAEKEQRRVPPPMHMGAVHQVYPSQGFALLRIIGPMPSAGTTLITHPVDGSTERMGNLVVSSDSQPRNGMIVADIRSGIVVSGDRVFLYRNIAPPPAAAAAPADAGVSTDRPQETGSELPPLRVRTTGVAEDAPVVESPLPPDAPAAEERGVPVSTPGVPTTPSAGPSSLPGLPSLPTEAPTYLNDIPNDIDQWD